MIAGLKPYPEYKDSGLPWLGRVPGHWDVRRIKTVLRECDRRSIDGGGTLLSLTRLRGLISRKDVTDKMHSAKTLVGYKLYTPGQIVMNRMQAWSGMFGAGNMGGMVSPDYAVFDVLGGHNSNLILERIKNPDMVEQFALESKGIGSGFNRLYTDRFGPISISLPPLEEQAAIVRFLDHATHSLDKAIRAKRKTIALLNEQKQAIIHRAVTRGLTPDVPLKDSGIPWLGQIPAHWEILRGKYLGRLFSTPSVLDNELTEVGDGNLMYLKVSDLAGADESFKLTRSRLYVKRPSARSENRRPLIVFPKRGGAIYTNRVAIIESTCLLDPNLMGWEISTRFDPHYVALLLKTRTLADLADVSSVPQINNHHINPTQFPAPPVEEQRAIVVELRTSLVGVNIAISRIEREIELLREYRTRLIADVVTGKLDVRKAAAHLPELENAPADEPELVEMEESGEELAEEDA